MLERVEIHNYRGLKHLKISNLNRINLIAGRNNTGKTTLLEAIFLLLGAGNPHLLINANVIRQNLHIGTQNHATFNTNWKPLFFELMFDKDIKMFARHSLQGQMELGISCKLSNSTKVPLHQPVLTTIATDINEWVLKTNFRLRGKKNSEGTLRLVGNELKLDQPERQLFSILGLIITPREGNIDEDADRLQQLVRLKQTHLLIDVLKIFEPNLRDIEVLFENRTPMIWVDIGLSELVPLTVLGEGMMRTIRLILAMTTVRNGVVLVDEIENGFHYSLMPEVWRRIMKVSERFGTQIIATTHSRECVLAAQESLPREQFTFHRLEVDQNGSNCVSFPEDALESVLKHDFEIR